MSQFELMVTAVSIVIGLGVAQILAAFVELIRARRVLQLDWMPITWAVVILVLHIQFFFGMYSLDQARPLTATDFVAIMVLAVLLFMAGGLILPSVKGSENLTTLLEDFDQDGRLALVPFALSSALGIALNAKNQAFLDGGGFFAGLLSAGVLLNTILMLCVVGVLISRRRGIQNALTLAYTALFVFAIFAVWARPGA